MTMGSGYPSHAG